MSSRTVSPLLSIAMLLIAALASVRARVERRESIAANRNHELEWARTHQVELKGGQIS